LTSARQSAQFQLEQIDQILLLLSRDVWPLIAFDDRENLISDDLDSRTQELIQHLSLALATTFDYVLPRQSVVNDLQFRYSIFRNSRLGDPRIPSRIDSLESCLRSLGAPPSVVARAGDILVVPKCDIDRPPLTSGHVIYSATQSGTLLRCQSSGADLFVFLLNILPSDEIAHVRAHAELHLAFTAAQSSLLRMTGICATPNRPFCLVYDFVPGARSLSEFVRASPTNRYLLQIAYKIALAVEYLHSRLIVCRNLISRFVLVNEMTMPFLLNYGITLQHEPRFMPPEWHESQVFTAKSDSYCFALLLWEMLTKRTPFADVPDSAFKNAIVVRGKRPDIPADTPDGLARLIRDCWATDPDDRPSFSKIVRLFESSEGFFSQSQALNADRGVRLSDPSIMQALENPASPAFAGTLSSLVTDDDRRLLIPNLVWCGLLDKLALALPRIPSFSVVAPTFRYLFDDRANLHMFVDCGGFQQLKLMQPGPLNEFLDLVSSVQAKLGAKYAVELAPVLISVQKFDLLKQILVANRAKTPTLGADVTKVLLQNLDSPAAESLLVESLESESAVEAFLQNQSFLKVVALGSIELIRTLRNHRQFLALFQTSDLRPLFEMVVQQGGRTRDAAAFFLLGLGHEVLEVFCGSQAFLGAVLRIAKAEIKYRLIVRLCRFPSGAEFFLGQPALFEKEMENPWLLTALSRIAGFFPSEVAVLSFLVPSLVRNLRETVAVEATLRLVGTLSQTPKLWEKAELVDTLFAALDSHRSEQLEIILILSILVSVAGIVNLDKRLEHILAVAERGEREVVAPALRVMAQLNLPFGNRKLVTRILAVALRNLRGAPAAASLLDRFDPHRLREMNVEGLIVKAAKAETDAAAFYAIISLLDHLDVIIPMTMLTKFDALLMDRAAGTVSAAVITTRESLGNKSNF
jgi:hypothetical protein